MERKQATQLWYNLIASLQGNRHGRIRFRNPAKRLDDEVWRGDYDDMDQQAFADLSHAVDEEAVLYTGSDFVDTGNLLLSFLRRTHLEQREIRMVAEVLSHASERIDYTTQEEEDTFEEDPDGRPSDTFCEITPQEIYGMLSSIYGQENAKRQAALTVFSHLQGRRRNAVFAGPTGAGKTEIWRILSKDFDFIRIYDASTIAADGWRGGLHIRSIFEDIRPDLREKSIIVLDEADKMLEPKFTSGGSGRSWDVAQAIQSNLLKIMDGDTLTFEDDGKGHRAFSVDCSHVSVVMLGSFETLLKKLNLARKPSIGFVSSPPPDPGKSDITVQDLITHGNMRREVAGRVSSVTVMHAMDEADYLRLLEDPEASPLESLQKQYHTALWLSRGLKARLAKEAAESGLGVRYIKSRLQVMVDDKLYDDPLVETLSLS